MKPICFLFLSVTRINPCLKQSDLEKSPQNDSLYCTRLTNKFKIRPFRLIINSQTYCLAKRQKLSMWFHLKKVFFLRKHQWLIVKFAPCVALLPAVNLNPSSLQSHFKAISRGTPWIFMKREAQCKNF